MCAIPIHTNTASVLPPVVRSRSEYTKKNKSTFSHMTALFSFSGSNNICISCHTLFFHALADWLSHHSNWTHCQPNVLIFSFSSITNSEYRICRVANRSKCNVLRHDISSNICKWVMYTTSSCILACFDQEGVCAYCAIVFMTLSPLFHTKVN